MNDDHAYWNGLAIIVGAAAALCALLLLCGCSTIRDAVDEYRDWRDSQTNAPAEPAVSMPEFDSRLFAGAGNVNWWAQSNAEVELNKLVAAGMPCYAIEAFGWGPTHGYDKPDEIITALERIVSGCKKRGIVLFVSLTNDNMGQIKHGNTDPRKLGDFLPQIEKVARWLSANDWPGLYVQPVAETQTDGGRAIEALCQGLFPKDRLVYNGDGGHPRSVPSWAGQAAYHATHLTDKVPAGMWDVTDHGTALGELGGTQAQAYDNGKVEADAKRAREANQPYVLYMFQQRVMDAGNLAAVHRGYYGTAPKPEPPKPVTDDAIDYGLFQWHYGGFKGGGALLSTPRIKGLQISGQKLAYSWAGADLSDWGLGHDQAGALACLFVQLPGGEWIGGKFEWISTSRTSRTLEHCEGYNGWTLAGVPNPCKAAFVIVTEDGKRRSNVLVAEWRR